MYTCWINIEGGYLFLMEILAIWSDVSLRTRPRYSLVINKDVKKPTKQAKIEPSSVTGPWMVLASLYILKITWLSLENKQKYHTVY